eukprot:244703-Amphidinium_carterae.1
MAVGSIPLSPITDAADAASQVTPLGSLTESYPLPGCWQSVYRAELHAIMVACERLQGSGRIVTDCKGAA